MSWTTHSFRIALAHTLRDDLVVALLVAGVSTVLALHPCSLEEELLAERTENDSVELLLDELVPVLFENLLLAFTHRALSA